MSGMEYAEFEDAGSAGEKGTMGYGFVDEVIRLESLAPGIVFGTVDVVCRTCGEISSLKCNADGSNTYICPQCGERTEL